MAEDVDDGADVEVGRPVVHRVVGRAVGFRDPCSLEELAADDARVAHRRLVDRDHVVGEVVGDDEAPALVLHARSVLQEDGQRCSFVLFSTDKFPSRVGGVNVFPRTMAGVSRLLSRPLPQDCPCLRPPPPDPHAP